MTRSYILLAAVGLATAACGSNDSSARNVATDASGRSAATASAAGPDGVVPGGAVDVLRREGWRVETIQQADASTVGEPATSAI